MACLYAPKIMPRYNVATFCSFVPILERFLYVLFQTHLAIVVKGPELVLSSRTAKIGSLAKETNALMLIHRQPKLSFAMHHCKVRQSNWILELDSLA